MKKVFLYCLWIVYGLSPWQSTFATTPVPYSARPTPDNQFIKIETEVPSYHPSLFDILKASQSSDDLNQWEILRLPSLNGSSSHDKPNTKHIKLSTILEGSACGLSIMAPSDTSSDTSQHMPRPLNRSTDSRPRALSQHIKGQYAVSLIAPLSSSNDQQTLSLAQSINIALNESLANVDDILANEVQRRSSSNATNAHKNNMALSITLNNTSIPSISDALSAHTITKLHNHLKPEASTPLQDALSSSHLFHAHHTILPQITIESVDDNDQGIHQGIQELKRSLSSSSLLDLGPTKPCDIQDSSHATSLLPTQKAPSPQNVTHHIHGLIHSTESPLDLLIQQLNHSHDAAPSHHTIHSSIVDPKRDTGRSMANATSQTDQAESRVWQHLITLAIQTDPHINDHHTQTNTPSQGERSTQTMTQENLSLGTQTHAPQTQVGHTQTYAPQTQDNHTQTNTASQGERSTQTMTQERLSLGTQTQTPQIHNSHTQTYAPQTQDNHTQTNTASQRERTTQTVAHTQQSWASQTRSSPLQSSHDTPAIPSQEPTADTISAQASPHEWHTPSPRLTHDTWEKPNPSYTWLRLVQQKCREWWTLVVKTMKKYKENMHQITRVLAKKWKHWVHSVTSKRRPIDDRVIPHLSKRTRRSREWHRVAYCLKKTRVQYDDLLVF